MVKSVLTLQIGMIPIFIDNNILEMVYVLSDERMMHVYIEHDSNE